MLPRGLTKELFGFLMSLMLIVSVSGCGGSSGNSSGGTPESPLPANTTIIEARTGPIVALTVGDTAQLDGTKSYVSSGSPNFTSSSASLSYSWVFSTKPDGSNATLANATTATPSFVADVRGDYLVELVVTANGETSTRSIQVVVATNPGERMTGPYNHVGLSSNCEQCHRGDFYYTDSNGATQLIMGKSVSHIATSLNCQNCHTPRGFDIAVKTDHQDVFGDCSSCHNGVIAVGKSEFHQVTELECNECHNTTSFLTLNADGTYDHSNVTRACAGCHNGTIAIGKTDTTIHNNTSSDCGFCHTTVDFKNAYPDHTGPDVVGKDCSTCHNGTDAKDSTGFHPDMSVDCAVCHEITGFKTDGVFDHTLIGVNPFLPACSECHGASNNIGAIGKTATHPATSDVCSDCHNTVSFADVTNFDHGTLDPAKRCDDCHGNTSATSPDIPALGLSADHVAINGADCKECHTPGTFTTGIFDHSTIGTARCDSCHDGSSFSMRGLSDGHIPTNGADCNGCHTDTVDFANYVMDHALVDVSVCGTCHDGNASTGKPVGHVPTKTLDCVACHYDANAYTDFALLPDHVFDHAAIDGNDCASCHAAGYATAKNSTHIPSDNECSLCHSDTSIGGFKTNNFRAAVHDALTSGCEGCHVKKFFPNNSAAYKASTHLPTTQDCSYCHTASAADFTTSTFSHAGINSNCASCHDGSANNVAVNALGEPNDTIHNTITADCSICHTINNNFLDGAYVDHTSPDVMAVRCDNCHNGDFTNNVPPAPVIKGKNFISNHPATTSDCIVCHASDPAADFKDGGVDHTSAAVLAQRCDSCHNGADAKGLADHPTNNHIPTSDDCGSCHTAGGSFKPSTFVHAGITNNCESCHDGNYIDAIGKQAKTNHVVTTQDCSVCHVVAESFAGASKFAHQGITGNCVSCHDGVITTGKNPNHFPTNRDCADCHQFTMTFSDGTFDHQGISNNCSSCHDAGYGLTGKPSGHPVTSKDCSVCHSGFQNFSGGVFDHSDIASGTRCDSCHDGNTALGKADAPTPHLDTSLDCVECHKNAGGSFKGGLWVHDSTTAGNCTNCHDGRYPNVDSKSSGHITVSVQCDVCHTTNNWSYSHKSSDYPGDHYPTGKAAPGKCSACHTTGFTTSNVPITRSNFPWKDKPVYAPKCGACHYNRGHSGHTDCTGSKCHKVSDRKWD
jgi:hypothetical protein